MKLRGQTLYQLDGEKGMNKAGKRNARPGHSSKIAGAEQIGSNARSNFLPAAKPTGLVEANSSLFFVSDTSKEGLNSSNQHGCILCSLGHKLQVSNLRSDLASEAVWRL